MTSMNWIESQPRSLVTFVLFTAWAVDANDCDSTVCIYDDDSQIDLTCTKDSPCHNMIVLMDHTTQYVECYDRSCQNATFFLTQTVIFSELRFRNADPDNGSNFEWISLMNIDIYTSADYSRVGISSDGRMQNMNVYAGSIYEFLPDWFSTTFSSYDNQSYWEPLTSQSATTLYLYGNENGTAENVNVYCNGSVDSCIVAAPAAGSDDAINDVTIYCTITDVESTSIAYPNNQGEPLRGALSPEHPKCIFWCTTNTTCNVKFFGIFFFSP